MQRGQIALPHLLLARLAWRLLHGAPLNRFERALLLQSGAQCALLYRFASQITAMLRLAPGWALTVPSGLLFFGLVMLNSALRVLTGRGVTWKGRRYDAGALS